MQVFPKEGYLQFYNTMVAKLKAGKPPVIKQTLQVLPNAFLGINGGYTTNLMWLLNVMDKTWEAALPKDTKKMLENFRKGRGLGAKRDAVSTLSASLKDFPYISTFAMDYSAELTQMMSQLASYTVMQSEQEIKAMLAAAAPQVQQPVAGAAKPTAAGAAAGAGATAAAAAAAAAVKPVAPAAAAVQPAAGRTTTAPPAAAAATAAAKPVLVPAAAAAAAAATRFNAMSAVPAAMKPAAAAAATPASGKGPGSSSTRT
jgi:hypothetical protein